MRRVRVLHLIDTLRPGGAEQLVLTTARHLDRTRFEPMVAVLGPPLDLKTEIEAAGAPVTVIAAAGPAGWVAAVWRLVRLLRSEGVDILHTHLRFSNVLGRIAAALARTPAVVTTLHHLDYTYWPPVSVAGRVWKGLDRLTARTVNDGFIAVSEAVRADYARHFGLAGTSLIYNYVDVEALRAALPPRDAARAALGWRTGEFVLLTLARLAPEKGHPHLLRAFAAVAAAVPDARLALAGEGPEESRLRGLADELGIGDRVTFLGNRRDVPALLAAADVFAFPSTGEGLGIALLEAMTAGLPSVASRVDGVREILHDGVDGLLVAPGDHAALAAAILRLHGDRALRDALGRAAQHEVARRFSLAVGLRAMEATYAALAARTGARAEEHV